MPVCGNWKFVTGEYTSRCLAVEGLCRWRIPCLATGQGSRVCFRHLSLCEQMVRSARESSARNIVAEGRSPYVGVRRGLRVRIPIRPRDYFPPRLLPTYRDHFPSWKRPANTVALGAVAPTLKSIPYRAPLILLIEMASGGRR